jgi:hypothetical protein
MKKFINFSLILTAMNVFFSGCLKDKGFDNNKYGINDPDKSPAGVGFPLAAKAKNTKGLNVSSTPQVFDDILVLNLESGYPAPVDINITLIPKASLIDDYNSANGTNMQTLPVSLYSVPDLNNIVIPKGERLVKIPITIINTTTLDPNETYGIGFQIASVDEGYRVADNLKNLLIELGIKNQYDGVYEITWTNYHPSLNPGYTGSTHEIELHTSGPNSCKMFWPAFPPDGEYCAPAVLGGSLSTFGSQEPNYTVDANDKVTVQNVFPGAVTFYSMAPGFNSHYDPATKTFYVKWGYGSGGPYPPFDPATSREWIQTFTYTGPR